MRATCLRPRYAICVFGERAFRGTYLLEWAARRTAAQLNHAAAWTRVGEPYDVHPQADFDEDGLCPHGRAQRALLARDPRLLRTAAEEARVKLAAARAYMRASGWNAM
ncbi:hypothetical protein [Nonomuraea sp. NPDC049646]|uniref:hypothetical protein n=1 Tax=unclassified Nonomuraea TaxID=2593643 RepID=UPI0037B4EC9A